MSLPTSRRLLRRAARAGFRPAGFRGAVALSVAWFVALATLTATAQPAAAEDIDLGVNAAIGLPCLTVDSWAKGAVSVTQRRAGKVIKTGTVKSSTVCVAPLKSGAALSITRGTTTRTVTVPSASLSMDLAANRVSGTLPAAAFGATLLIQDFTAGYSTGLSLRPPLTVEAGAFSADTTESLDLGRGDRVIVSWSDGSDAWRLIRETPTAVVEPGSWLVVGTGRPGGKATVTLKTRKGVVRGVAVATVKTMPHASAGFFDAAFRKSGRSVAVKGGNVVVAKGLSGSFRVPGAMPIVNQDANRVDATCPAGSDWLVLHDLTKVGGGRSASGSISVSPVNPNGPLALGTRVLVACQVPSGFGVVREVVLE